jgi:Uma2 family endonuclease
VHTYNDYAALPLREGERVELIDGIFYAMAAPNDMHQAISARLTYHLFDFFSGKKCQVRAAPYDVRPEFKENGQDIVTVQPDLVVICDPSKIAEDGCHGAPDLVIEILSPSNNVQEMYRKLRLYERVGVREYWLVNPEKQSVQINDFTGNFNPLIEFASSDTIVSNIFSELEIKGSDIFY